MADRHFARDSLELRQLASIAPCVARGWGCVQNLFVGCGAARGDEQSGSRTILDSEALFSSFKGSLAEQLVAQEMLANGLAGDSAEPDSKLHYFVNPSTRTEIDFIIDGGVELSSRYLSR